MKYRALVCAIVDHGKGEKLARLLREKGASGGTILLGRGSEQSALLHFLELADSEKDILMTLVGEEEREEVIKAIHDFPLAHPHKSDMAFIIPLEGARMKEASDHELISVIVNRGFADDIMDAARKAGAKGGTIIHARGTGTAHDEKFFGITIVPEKEQVLILSEREKASTIRKAIEELPCLKTPGMGIIFSMPVEHFTQLGHGPTERIKKKKHSPFDK